MQIKRQKKLVEYLCVIIITTHLEHVVYIFFRLGIKSVITCKRKLHRRICKHLFRLIFIESDQLQALVYTKLEKHLGIGILLIIPIVIAFNVSKAFYIILCRIPKALSNIAFILPYPPIFLVVQLLHGMLKRTQCLVASDGIVAYKQLIFKIEHTVRAVHKNKFKGSRA